MFLDALPKQTEAQFQATVIDLLTGLGWPKDLIYHTLRSTGSTAGFPDLVAVKPTDGRLLMIELKAQRGRPTDAQTRWINALTEVRHITSGVFRPNDLEKLARLLR